MTAPEKHVVLSYHINSHAVPIIVQARLESSEGFSFGAHIVECARQGYVASGNFFIPWANVLFVSCEEANSGEVKPFSIVRGSALE